MPVASQSGPSTLRPLPAAATERTNASARRDSDSEFSSMLKDRVQNEPVQSERVQGERNHTAAKTARGSNGARRQQADDRAATKGGDAGRDRAPEKPETASSASMESNDPAAEAANNEAPASGQPRGNDPAAVFETALEGTINPTIIAENPQLTNLSVTAGPIAAAAGEAVAKADDGVHQDAGSKAGATEGEAEAKTGNVPAPANIPPVEGDSNAVVVAAVVAAPINFATVANPGDVPKASPPFPAGGKAEPAQKQTGENKATSASPPETEAPAAPQDSPAPAKAMPGDKAAPGTKPHGREKPAPEFAALVRTDNAPAQGQNSADPAPTPAQGPLQAATLLAPNGAAPAAPSHAAAVAPATGPTVPLEGVAVTIAAKAESGTHHFEIRLDPPELGRIEVRLDVDRNGAISSHLIADRPDTLAALRRDAAGLERALHEAGLKTGDTAMQFSLRDQNAGGNPTPTPAQIAHLRIEEEISAINEAAVHGYGRAAALRGGIDIRV